MVVGCVRLVSTLRRCSQSGSGPASRVPRRLTFSLHAHVRQATTHGWFTIRGYSIAKRMRVTLVAIKRELHKRMHRPLGDAARWLASVLRGWLNCHAVPGNKRRLKQFTDEVHKLWFHALRRRSEKGKQRWTWKRMTRLVRKHLPTPRILHPYPEKRFHARLTQGESRMR